MSDPLQAVGEAGGLAAPAPSLRERTALSQEWGVFRALWRRDLLRLQREPSRWLGIVFQPLLLWVIIGSGMAASFRMPGAESVPYLEYFFPGVLVMIVLFTAIFATISVIEDRQSGFLQGVLVAPGSRAAMVLGKLAGVTSLALIQALVFVPLAPLAGYPLGSIAFPALAVAVVLACVGLTAIGFAMAWVLSSSQAYHAVMSVVLIPLWMLSGAMFPAAGGWVGVVMTVNPMTYAVAAARAAMDGATDVAALGVLAAFAAAAVSLAVTVAHRVGARAS